MKTKQKQSRETGNIGYTRRRKTKQKQSRETGNIGYTTQRKTKQKQSRETGKNDKNNYQCKQTFEV